MKILIADSMSDYVATLSDALSEEADFELVGTAGNGYRALEMVLALRPDVLLADILLPGMDGLRLLRKIRESGLKQKPVALFVSSALFPTMLEEAKQLRVEYVMLKPVELDALVERIRLVGGAHSPENTAEREERLATDDCVRILRKIGIPLHMQGYRFLREAIRLVQEDGDAVRQITKAVYPSIARSFSTSRACVERGISYAIQRAWEEGEEGAWLAVFGIPPRSGRKPTNSTFIAHMVEYIAGAGRW